MAIDFKKFIKGIVLGNDVDPSKKLQVEVTSSATTATKTTVQASQTADRTIILPDASTTLVGQGTTDTLTNKTIDADLNTITNIENADIKSGAAIDAAKLADGSVSNAEFQYLANVTSDIQTQFNNTNTAITDHVNDATDAHDASAISNIPSGNLAATDQQAANNELQSDIDLRLLKAGDTMSGNLNMGSNLITSLGTPVSGTDATNKNYVDGIAAGLDPKESVRVATAASVGGSYATTPSNGQFTGAATTVDGVALSVSDRVLIKDQADQKQNGIYVYTAAGEFTRSADMDGSPASEVSGGNFVFVAEGATNGASGYVLIANGLVTLNTDNVVFTQFSGGANSANKTLSNLDSPTSINQSLIPAANSTQDLGTTAKRFQDVYASTLKDASGVTVLNQQNRQLTDTAGNPSLTFSSTTEMNANSKKISSLANGTNLTDAFNKQNVQNALKNLIADGDGEGADIFSLYNDGASSRPVDGTGGTVGSVITTTVTSTGAIDGVRSFLLTKTAVNAQGYGWSVPFTISKANQAKVMQIEFDYIVNSGTFTAGSSTTDSDLIAYIYDVTNNTLIEPSSFKLLSNSSTIGDKVVTNFQTSATGTSYRLILHVATTNASAWALMTDNFSVKPCNYVFGTPITDWVAYTPTFTAMGSVTGINFQSRRVGDSLQVRGRFTLATTTGAEAQMTLGYGGRNANITLDSNKISNIQKVGMAGYSPSFDRTLYVMGEPATNYVTFSAQSSGIFNKLAGTSLGSTGEIFSIDAEVPITGWSSSVQMSDSYDGRLIAATYRTSADVTITTSNADVVWNTKIDDSTGMMNTSTGIVTVPSAGKYAFNITGRLDTGAVAPGEVQFGLIVTGKSAGTYILYDNTNLTALKINPLSGGIELEMNAGDTAKINAVSTTNSSTLKGGSSLYTNFNIKKLQAPTTISATEVVAFMAEGASSAALGSNTTIPFNTPALDTHAGWNATNKDYTVPYAGIYKVYTQLRVTSGGGLAVNQYIDSIIQIDGVTKREFVKYVENTGAAGWEVGVSWQGYLNAGQKIRAVGDTNIGSPSLTTSTTHTFLEIFRIK
jgi:hypothetical protein